MSEVLLSPAPAPSATPSPTPTPAATPFVWKLAVGLLPVGVLILVVWSVFTRVTDAHPPLVTSGPDDDLAQAVARVNEFFRNDWQRESLAPAARADELDLLRRLSLALCGTVPSLEEIRAFERDDGPDRIRRWAMRMLDDDRFAEYFAERLARSLVGVENGQFIVFRRGRFVDWLAAALKENRPYDALVREMIAGEGLWTGSPQTNFITAAVNQDDLDENKLAGRGVRAFLGQRMDCAQCHDHPFDVWKERDFEGLAAYFGQTRFSVLGVVDVAQQKGKPVRYEVEDRKTQQKRAVDPCVPFHPEWLPAEGSPRARLAGWITHPDNRRFDRAIANRVWGLLFGKPYSAPVDSLPDPKDVDADNPELLDLLGADFRKHGCDLKRLILVIALSEPFQLQSVHPADDADVRAAVEAHWAVFPLVRLRPDQVIGSMLQAASVKTIDRNSHLFVRVIRFARENDFIKEYGDPGEDELNQQAGTVPQALLRMNGKLAREIIQAGPISASGRIASLASTDEKCLETCYLVCLTRRPTEAERTHFLAQLQAAKGKERTRVVEDVYWSLFNSPEFSWNH